MFFDTEEKLVSDQIQFRSYLIVIYFLSVLFKTPCMSNPCRNGGTCQPIYDKDDYQCKCPFKNLSGKNCEDCKYQ